MDKDAITLCPAKPNLLRSSRSFFLTGRPQFSVLTHTSFVFYRPALDCMPSDTHTHKETDCKLYLDTRPLRICNNKKVISSIKPKELFCPKKETPDMRSDQSDRGIEIPFVITLKLRLLFFGSEPFGFAKSSHRSL